MSVLGFDSLGSLLAYSTASITYLVDLALYQGYKLVHHSLRFYLESSMLLLRNKVFFLPFFSILIYSIVLMLVVTLIIASITLLERKLLSLVQRRVGPNFVGYKGRLQYLADALKLFLKGVAIPSGTNSFFFVAMPSLAGAVCYTF